MNKKWNNKERVSMAKVSWEEAMLGGKWMKVDLSDNIVSPM